MQSQLVSNQKFRQVLYYEDYYLSFFETLSLDEKQKFNWTLKLIESVQRVPEKYFKSLTNSEGIFEIRVEVNSTIYRVFSFFDEGNLIILMNGFKKKTQKTPRSEIKKAELIKKNYFYEKQIT